MAENYVLLESITLTETSAIVIFDNIPQTGYTDLRITVSCRNSVSAVNSNMTLKFNGSTTTYSTVLLEGNGSSVSSASLGNSWNSTIGIFAGSIPGANASSNTFSSTEIVIPNYTSSKYKSVSIDGLMENNATTSYLDITAGLWATNSAITSITLGNDNGNFVANSTFSLYGIADVNTTPVTAPLAIGGNQIVNDGTYWYHTFTSSGNFTVGVPLTCDYLIVGGGGGPGSVNLSAGYPSGGGGAGGYRTSIGGSTINLTPQTYVAIVGAGGFPGLNGNNSSLTGTGLSISATGGGRGGYGGTGGTANSTTGGSGGGGGATVSTSGSAGNAGGYTPVEGYAGANASGTTSGGGGGAGGAAGSAPTGGAGASNSITGTAVTYARGGNGNTYGTTGTVTATPAGYGNGGNGGRAQYYDGSTGNSGVVIIRYPMV